MYLKKLYILKNIKYILKLKNIAKLNYDDVN